VDWGSDLPLPPTGNERQRENVLWRLLAASGVTHGNGASRTMMMMMMISGQSGVQFTSRTGVIYPSTADTQMIVPKSISSTSS